MGLRLAEVGAGDPGRGAADDIPAPPRGERADNALLRTDERERVRAALGQIAGPQREAIDLAFFAGLTQKQIAEKLGTPLGTVKARIRRGLLALRDALQEVAS